MFNLTLAEKKIIAVDIITGITELHKINQAHFDLKPKNILLINKRAFLTDLGINKVVDYQSSYNET